MARQLIKKKFAGFTLLLCLSISISSFATVKTSVATGNWNVAASWSPSGVPVASDSIVILNSHKITVNADVTIKYVEIKPNGILQMSPGKNLILTGGIKVGGIADMNYGNILMQNAGSTFEIINGGTFIWNPADNTATGATLLTNGTESFAPASNLVIKKWYNYGIPLAVNISGNLGNVTMSSLVGPTLMEWNQNNQFETHQIIGTLSIDQGWIVLDKSGSISNTTIGNIYLTNVNSYLDFHSGTHWGTFAVNTNTITNVGGVINGIYNGDGNVNLNVTNDFTNLGNVALIYNSGINNIGNGNASIHVGGKYKQTYGDFRGIFNLSTTLAGTIDLNFHDVELNGGVMLGLYACHSAGGTSKFNVTGNFAINFSNSIDKFRAIGLTSLQGHFSNTKLDMNIGGDLILNGLSTAEFTSSGGVGIETINIQGNSFYNGLTSNFNYGSHAVTIVTQGNITVNGGTCNLSRLPGNVTITIGGNLNVQSGTLACKSNTGIASAIVNGNFIQTGGDYFLHNNTNIPTNDAITFTIKGNFIQTGGILNYEDNTSSQATHQINIESSIYTVGGNGKITRAGSGSSTVFGFLNFKKQGITNYNRSSTTHIIEQVKQNITNGCTLNVTQGDFQVASHFTTATDYLRIQQGGILNMQTHQVISNGLSGNCGLRVDAGGTLATGNANGLFNSTGTACIKSSNNMNYFLDPNSIVEYNGTTDQLLTGINDGIATSDNHKYGVLSINFNGNPDSKAVKVAGSHVYIRTQLKLLKGELYLNSQTLTLENGNPDGIIHDHGYIKSEHAQADNKSIFKWENVSAGDHEFPFGASSFSYIPINFNPLSGFGGDVAISTRRTGVDNKPYPAASNVNAVTNMIVGGLDFSVSEAIDRWYNISAPGFRADVTIAYDGFENTTATTTANGTFSIRAWDGNKWIQLNASANGVTNGIGKITAHNATLFSPWCVALKSAELSQPEVLNFNASLLADIVQLNWDVSEPMSAYKFVIERSATNNLFEEVESVAGNSNLNYQFIDKEPLKGKSYYRLKEIKSDGSFKYSESLIIINGESVAIEQLDIQQVYPNPFRNNFKISYYLGVADEVKFELTNSAGQMVHMESKYAEQGINTFDYTEDKALPVGVYIVTLIGNKARISKKIYKNS